MLFSIDACFSPRHGLQVNTSQYVFSFLDCASVLARARGDVPRATFLESTKAKNPVPPGADYVFVVRHAERNDHQVSSDSITEIL